MAYSDHVGWGHTWRRTGQRVYCQCGLPLPVTSDRSLPRDQKGQLACALAMDLLAQHGLIVAGPPDQTQGEITFICTCDVAGGPFHCAVHD